MGFHVLGPVHLTAGDRRIDLGSGKERAVLAVLVLNAGRPCSTATLIDRVWGEDPPTQVRSALYSYISRIRKALRETGQPDYALRQRNGGYVLDVPAEVVDVQRFEAALNQARSAGQPEMRVNLLRDALDCWQGTALQDVSGRWAEETRQALARKRVGACVDWAKAMIDLGRHADAVDVLEREFAEHPYAEPIAARLMVALHKLGRQSEALACYAAVRERLAEDLGVEPGAELQQVHLQLLRDTNPPAPQPEQDGSADDPELARAYQRLADAANEWDQHGRDDSMVYRGARLAAWLERDPGQLTALEREFLAAGQDLRSHEQAARRRRVHVALVSLSFGLVAMLLLVVVIAVESDRAQRQRERALAGEFAAAARNQVARDPELALLLALRAVEIDPSESAQAVLAQALAESRVRATWRTHKGPTTGVDVNGARVVSAGEDGTLRIWSLDGSTGPIVVHAHKGPVRDVAFSMFGDRIVSVGDDGALRIWSADGNPIAAVEHIDVTAVAWQPGNGEWIGGVGKNGQVRAWPSDGRGLVRQFHKHGGAGTGIDWSSDGLLASTAEDGTMILHDLTTGTVRMKTNDGGALLDVDISPSGTHVITGGADGHTKIWPARNDDPPLDRRDHKDAVHTVAYSKNGEYVITGGHDRIAHIRRANDSGDAVVLRGAGGPIQGVTFTEDNARALTASDDGTVRAWDPSAKPNLETLRGHSGATADVAFSPDGKFVVSAGLDGSAWLKEEKRAAGVPMRAVAVSPDGRHVVTAGDGGTMIVWPVFGKREPWRIDTGHAGTIRSAAFSPDRTTVASVGDDGIVRISQINLGITRETHRTGSAGYAVAFSADGRFLASAHEDGNIRLRTLTGGEEPVLVHGPEEMRAIAFSPDGGFIAGAGDDGTVRVWPTTGHGDPVLLNGHYGRVNDLAFSEDGQYIASVGDDQKVRLWKWAARADPVVYEQHGPATVTSVDFGLAKRVVVGRGDGTADVWTCDVCVPVQDLLSLARLRATRELTDDERRLYLDGAG